MLRKLRLEAVRSLHTTKVAAKNACDRLLNFLLGQSKYEILVEF
jgi:hypothetical protein